jgi:hypothetical protein
MENILLGKNWGIEALLLRLGNCHKRKDSKYYFGFCALALSKIAKFDLDANFNNTN